MSIVRWAVFYEGETDADYFNVLVPRLIEALVRERGVRPITIAPMPVLQVRLRERDAVAAEACSARDAFDLFFIHADQGGRIVAETLARRSAAICQEMARLCDWPDIRCVTIAPRRETEAWVLADTAAVMTALRYRGQAASLGLPADARAAERLPDPKAVLSRAIRIVRGRRRAPPANHVFPMIAQHQDLSLMRGASSFNAFEIGLARALTDLGCIR